MNQQNWSMSFEVCIINLLISRSFNDCVKFTVGWDRFQLVRFTFEENLEELWLSSRSFRRSTFLSILLYRLSRISYLIQMIVFIFRIDIVFHRGVLSTHRLNVYESWEIRQRVQQDLFSNVLSTISTCPTASRKSLFISWRLSTSSNNNKKKKHWSIRFHFRSSRQTFFNDLNCWRECFS